MLATTKSPSALPEATFTPETDLTDRETLLRAVLEPYDYQYVKDHKLDELFFYDQKTGEDGLRHILTGELIGKDRIPKGFHHGPSAERVAVADELGRPLTRATRIVDANGNAAERKPMSPYLAEVMVDGKEKHVAKRSKNGEATIRRGVNSMFPQEYDAFTIMKTIDLAIKNADPAQDRHQKMSNGKWYYSLVGKVPLLDGRSEMAVRVILDYETVSVVTAYPLMKHSDTMELTEEQVTHHATYGLASAAGKTAVGAGTEAAS